MAPLGLALSNTLHSSLAHLPLFGLQGLVLGSALMALRLTPKYVHHSTTRTPRRFMTTPRPLLHSSAPLLTTHRPSYSSLATIFTTRHYTTTSTPCTSPQCTYAADKATKELKAFETARAKLDAYVSGRIGATQAEMIHRAYIAETSEAVKRHLADVKEQDATDLGETCIVLAIIGMILGSFGWFVWDDWKRSERVEESTRKMTEARMAWR